MTMRRILVACSIIAVLMMAAPASAVPLQFGNTSNVYFLGTGLGLGGQDIVAPGIGAETAFAGKLEVSGFDLQSFYVYCVDATSRLVSPELMMAKHANTLPLPAGNPPGAVTGAGAKIAWLVNTYYWTATTNDTAAGLQLAIWEVLYDTTYSFSGGAFRWTNAGGGALTAANAYLAALGTNTADAIWLDVVNAQGVDIREGQDYVYPIPEPGSMLLFGSGLVGLARFARRRR